ncbi:MBG domain-containing protein [Acidicapsa acidisoli]|uniref:MBG domain-containing protein n=1 Tax=Acidicapsa acidisoli TaxID=1615681 RepID=UPI0021DFE96A|nr:MBG domain-containing protein [Acidicapsa acidisoli]
MNVCRGSLLKPKPVLGLLAVLFTFASGTGIASAATTIKILRGADQQTTYGASFPDALVVWVTDTVTERAVTGLKVDFVAGAGIGLTSTYAITDEYGLASVSASGLGAGDSEVSAEVAGIPGTKVTFYNLAVNKAPLFVVPGDLRSVVGSPIPPATSYRFKGFVNGDTEDSAQITGTPVLTTTATDHSPHANYAIKGNVGSLSAPNYTFVPEFGTLAILERQTWDGLASGDAAAIEAAVIEPSAIEGESRVHTAFLGQLESLTMVQPNFIAGLRGESGIFVRAAIWSNPVASSAYTQSLPAQTAIENVPLANMTALPTFAAGMRIGSDAPVHSVVLPHVVTASTLAKSSSTRSAIPAVVSDSRKGSDAPVRAAFVSKPSIVSVAVQNSNSGQAIRKAFNPPGNE